MSKTDALAAIYKKLDRDICRACPYRVFLECENDTALPVIKEAGMRGGNWVKKLRRQVRKYNISR